MTSLHALTIGRPRRAPSAVVPVHRALLWGVLMLAAYLLAPAPAGAATTAQSSPATDLALAVSYADAHTLEAITPIGRCRGRGKARCLRRQGRPVVAAADQARRVVRIPTRAAQARSCPRRAGTRYLRALGVLRRAGIALGRGRFEQAQRLMRRAANAQLRAGRAVVACLRS